ncbi:MAG: hypothetical protein KKG64_02325, partial [Firmicutes bacterium]|nr:hypothetical protein [Bacillota bacterium]
IKKSLFELDSIFQSITKIEIYQENDLFTEIPLLIESSDFSVKADIEAYISANSIAPNESFGNVSMAPIIHIDTTPMVLRNIAIYSAIVIGLTVFIFSMKKRRLGKKEPTQGVKQDIERLGQQDHKEQ